MIGLILAGLGFTAFGLAARLLLRSERWMTNVLNSQNRLAALLRGSRTMQTKADVRRGVWAFTVFATFVGVVVIALAICDALA